MRFDAREALLNVGLWVIHRGAHNLPHPPGIRIHRAHAGSPWRSPKPHLVRTATLTCNHTKPHL